MKNNGVKVVYYLVGLKNDFFVFAVPPQRQVALHRRKRQRPVVSLFPVAVFVLLTASTEVLSSSPKSVERKQIKPGRLGALAPPVSGSTTLTSFSSEGR